MASGQQFVIVLPDGTEFFGAINSLGRSALFDIDLSNLCTKAVRNAGLTTSRTNPQRIKVEVFHLVIVNGKLERKPCRVLEVESPKERMTNEEYDAEMVAILEPLPEEFHSFVRSQSWDRGHSASLEEVVNIASEMVFELKPCIDRYTKAMH